MNRLKRSAALLLAALTVLSMSGMTAFAEAGLPEPTAAAENGEPDVDGVPEQKPTPPQASQPAALGAEAQKDENDGQHPQDRAADDAQPAANTDLVKENVEITVGEIVYTVDFYDDGSARWACLWDVSNPPSPTSLALPETFSYEGVEYPVTQIQFTQWDKRRNVTALTLPDTLTAVNHSSFYKFPALKEITIPGSIKNFDGSFQNMSDLLTITFDEGVEEISSNSMVYGCDVLAEINLPTSLKRITAPAAFASAPALKSIHLPEGLVIAEGSLLSDCTALTHVELPASITEIPSNTFSGCSKLERVTARGQITAIGLSAFYQCSALKEIPDLGAVKRIESNAFEECTALTGPVNLSRVTEMGACAFYKCKQLTGAVDLSRLAKIPDQAFSYTDIEAVTLSDELTSIGRWGFLGTKLKTIAFPETLISIGPYAFCYSDQLSGTVVIPDRVTEIGTCAFQDTRVEHFEIGSGVEILEADVFKENPALKEIVIHNSQDHVTIQGQLEGNVTVQYTQQSMDDAAGDTISGEPDAPTLQEAVNAAAKAENGGTIKLEKNVKLAQAVTVPKGKTVTITAEQPFQIAGTKTANLKNLFLVEEGGSLVLSGSVTLFGRYNIGSVLLNYGSLTLAGEAVVTSSRIASDTANGLNGSGIGVIDNRGEKAVFTLSGGKITRNALNDDSIVYSGIVRASDGAKVIITGGEISGNQAVAVSAPNCSSGLLLMGHSSAVMSGGKISGNTGHRGSAVMLFGNDDKHRTTFEMHGGILSNNNCSSKLDVEGSGAVHVEDHAKFHMTGGEIAFNKGGQGAGVCVVDGNLQMSDEEYKTAFVMDGGKIHHNKGSIGGGIYSYSNGVKLKAGEISDNTAYNMGGGMYSEGNYDHYSTMHLSNALITENTARLGGGLWFCATGETSVHITEGAAIFDNTARDTALEKGAGDDFVFASNPAEDFPATLPNRMLGGGAAQWYKDGAIYLPAAGVYPSVSEKTPRYGTSGADMTPVTVENYVDCLSLKLIPCSQEGKDLARREAKLIIRGNHADMGGGIGANGGIDIGKEENTSVAVSKKWVGGNEASRPESVTVQLLSNGVVIDTADLSAANNWAHSFEKLPTTDAEGDPYQYNVEELTVPGYSSRITGDSRNGFVITNTKTSSGGDGGGGGSSRNDYTSLTVNKTWTTDDGRAIPEFVRVELLRDGQRYQIVELSAENRWTYTWKHLNDRYDWSVAEMDTPEGFVSTVSHRGKIWTITNNDIPIKENPSTGR